MTQPNTAGVERSLNQFVVQWDVAGALNGNPDDMAPGLATAGGVILPAQQDEDGVFRINVPGDLGILDPDALGAIGGSGDRYIQWIRVESGTGGNIPPGFAIRIVDAAGLVTTLGDPIVLEQINLGVLGVAPSFYRSQFYFVPQGAAIQFAGLSAPAAGQTHQIKIGFRSATSAREDAELQRAMCCQSGADDGGGGGGGGSPGTLVSLDYYSFSSQNFTAVGDEDGTYFHFAALYDAAVPLAFAQESDSIINGNEGIVSVSAEKLVIRPGGVSGMALRSSTSLQYRPFIERSGGGGPFIRTFLTPGVLVLLGNTTTIVPGLVIGGFLPAERIRVGIVITTNVADATIQAEVEITTTG